MQNFLNLTLPLKQDAASQAGVQQLVEKLRAEDSPLKKKIEDVLANSTIVHFARFLVVGAPPQSQYLQVLTTFDGDENTYAEFFFNELHALFQSAYEFVEGAPTGENFTLGNFREFNKRMQDTQAQPFFVFSAYPDKTVKAIKGLVETPWSLGEGLAL